MVAETLKSPPDSPPDQLSPKTPAKDRKPGYALTFHLKLKARNLYLSQGLGRREIAERCGLTEKQVANLISREKLPAIRKRREKGLEKRSDAHAQATLEQFNAELAEQAEEISLGALQRARNEVDDYGKDSARNFQSLTGGIANLVKASRMVRGLDARGNGAEGPQQTLVFVGALQRVQDQPTPPNEKRAEVVEVQAKAIPDSPAST